VRFDLTDIYPSYDDSGFMDPSFMDPSFVDSSSGSFSGAFGLIIVLMVIGVVVSIALSLRRANKYREAGIDPLDPETDLKVRMAQRMGMAPPPTRNAGTAETAGTGVPPARDGRTTAERLAEVDRLHESGAISAAEHQSARARILGTI
jgi:hypothetical protein